MIASENRLRISPPIDADSLGDFCGRSRRCGSFEKSCDKISQPDGLTLLAIRSNKRRKLRERAHLANAGEFNGRYLTCQISAILYADRGDRRELPGVPGAAIVVFADRCDRGSKEGTCRVISSTEFNLFLPPKQPKQPNKSNQVFRVVTRYIFPRLIPHFGLKF